MERTSTTGCKITNANEYRGFLLYAYVIRNELVDSNAKLPRDWVLRKRDPTARMIRSGGESSPFGGFQVAAGRQTSIRRSGGLEIEVQGNYNTKGWLVIFGAFGNEYHGQMPGGRWLITKLDLLYAQAIGYELRGTSAFKPEPGP
jgi:hypothetical protein